MGIFMKWDKSIVPVGKLPLRFLFVIGFAVGFLIVYWGKGTFLKNMGMLDEDTLYHMKYMAVDNKVLFWYVLCKRGHCTGSHGHDVPGIVILWWDDSKIWLFPWIILRYCDLPLWNQGDFVMYCWNFSSLSVLCTCNGDAASVVRGYLQKYLFLS